MIRIRRLATILHSTVLVAALAVPVHARASVWSVVGVRADEPASVLGLESADAAAGDALTKALRKAFAKRGLAGGQEMSLSELRLTMGCSGDDPKCLAEGGKAIEVRRLVYGRLEKTGGGYTLQLNMLDVSGAVVEKELARPLSASDLAKDKVDATATAIVQAMLPEETDEVPVSDGGFVDQPVTDPTDDGARPQPRPKRDKKYVFGKLDKPVPRWKKVGVGVSAGLFVLSLGTAIGLSVATRGALRDKLVRRANESLLDTYPDDHPMAGELYMNNDVDPTEEKDICRKAREHPPEDTANPDSVRNKRVTEVCNVADGVEKGQFAAWAATAVFGVSTIVFTVLMFVKKNDNAAAAAAWRHGLRIGAAPSRSGMSMGASFKF